MPKAPMSEEEVEIIRGRILDTALEIMIQEGFTNLSIRKLSSRLGVTPTTIYNYYKNKDELNLMIRLRGFEKLYQTLIKAAEEQIKLEDRIATLIRAYITFGMTYPGYYDIMFNLHTPKYLNYVGTDLEASAENEKQTALKCLDLFLDPIYKFVDSESPETQKLILDKVVMFWSDLHGLVTLYNSRLFHEVLSNVDSFIEKRTSELITDFIQTKKRAEAGELF